MITDRFSKVCRSIPMKTVKASVVATVFLDQWVYPYGAPSYLLTDNGPQFTAKFFAAVCYMLGMKQLFTTAYHPQTNGQTERFNKTLVQRLRHYVEEHQTDWDVYTQPLTYAYNMQVHRSTGTTPFDLILTRHPPAIAVTTRESAIPQSVPENISPAQLKVNTLRRLETSLSRARTNITAAGRRYKDNFDLTVRFIPTFRSGDMVFLDRPPRPLNQTETDPDESGITKRLLPRSEGPFQVITATDSTVTILQDGLQNTVSIDRVTKDPVRTTANTTEGRNAQPTVVDNRAVEPEEQDDNRERSHESEEYPVEKLVGHRETPSGMEYLVRWYGYTATDDQYVQHTDIPENFVRRYWRTRSGRASS